MGEILAVGITHYPPLDGSAETMRAEWGNDEGTSAAHAHRERLLRSLQKARTQIDEFRPDFIVVWGDDQYENFREDVVPPYCIYAHAYFEFGPGPTPNNIWNEPADKKFRLRGNVAAAKYLAGGLIEAGFDTAYSYKP